MQLPTDIDELVRLEDALEHIADYGVDYQSRSEYIGCYQPASQEKYAAAFDAALPVIKAYGTARYVKAQNAVERQLRILHGVPIRPMLDDEEPEECILG